MKIFYVYVKYFLISFLNSHILQIQIGFTRTHSNVTAVLWLTSFVHRVGDHVRLSVFCENEAKFTLRILPLTAVTLIPSNIYLLNEFLCKIMSSTEYFLLSLTAQLTVSLVDSLCGHCPGGQFVQGFDFFIQGLF